MGKQKLNNRYLIKQISCSRANQIAVQKHYLHRKAPCSQAFGLIDKEQSSADLFKKPKIVGIIIYGTPSSAPLRSGICGDDEARNVVELTRLWIEDGTPKNVESFLIGNTIKLVDKEIIVSFSEIEQGHLGLVYQASNFYYTGLSAKRTDWNIEGIDTHSQTIADKYSAKQVREKYGNKFNLSDRPRKHRYIYFNANRRRKRELLKKLKYQIQTFPKQKSKLNNYARPANNTKRQAKRISARSA